jgi:hypothetical protein
MASKPKASTSAPDDEDSYVIKCICNYDDDDGSTVLCEVCDTWQHILCYYPDIEVPDVHECIGCQPREMDAKGAVERQRQSRINSDADQSDLDQDDISSSLKVSPLHVLVAHHLTKTKPPSISMQGDAEEPLGTAKLIHFRSYPTNQEAFPRQWRHLLEIQ